MVVLLGIDVHKGTHTAVAVDEVGQKIGQCVVAATDGGHRQLLGWALSRWSGDRFIRPARACCLGRAEVADVARLGEAGQGLVIGTIGGSRERR